MRSQQGSRGRRARRYSSGVTAAVVGGVVICLAIITAGVAITLRHPTATSGRVGEALASAGVIALVIFVVETARDSRRERAADRRAFALFLATNPDLREVDLSGADLRGLDLRGRDLRNANLNSARLDDVDLSYAKLTGARASGTTFRRARLNHADLRLADLRGSDFLQAELDHADARGALWSSSRLVRASAKFVQFQSLTESEAQEVRRAGDIRPTIWYFQDHLSGRSFVNSVDARNGDFAGADFSSACLSRTDFTFARLGAHRSNLLASSRSPLAYIFGENYHAMTEWHRSYTIDDPKDATVRFAGADLDGVRIDADRVPQLDLSVTQAMACVPVTTVPPAPRRWRPRERSS